MIVQGGWFSRYYLFLEKEQKSISFIHGSFVQNLVK